MNTSVMFSSKTDMWATPQDFFEEVDKEFNFNLDVCAIPENAKCSKYFSPDMNGLEQEWNGMCWMNPPYGREIGKWIKKAFEESLKGATVVCLLPSRTDTRWFHHYIYHRAEVRFLKGRIKFGGAENNAPFPNMLVIFRGVRR